MKGTRIRKRCRHRDERPLLGYVAWTEEADRRRAAGEKQRFCRVCKRWIWESYWEKA